MIERPTRLDPLRAHPDGVAWPTREWEAGELGDGVDKASLTTLLDTAFDPSSDSTMHLSLATVIVQGGQIVAERYGETAGPDESLISWSMAKSVVQSVVGILMADGLLDPSAPAPVAEWADDERKAITIADLLSMTSGLRFEEDYVDDSVSHVIDMLFGDGKDDTAGYARNFPLDHEPGTVFNYSSGTTNIVSSVCGDIISPDTTGSARADAVRAFMAERLFAPIGMVSADARCDDAGTFVGSSFLYCNARDFARFGYLNLRGGVWDGQQILPEGWVDAARAPVELDLGDENFWYGNHWWLWDDTTGAFGCHGYEGQYIIVVPARDLVVVRLGKTSDDFAIDRRQWMSDVIACFPEI